MGKNAWMDHVKEVRKTPEASGLSLKEVLKLAKKSYKKVSDNINEKVVKAVSAKKVSKSVKRVSKTLSRKVKKPLTGKRRRKRRGKKSYKRSRRS
jgi:Fe-S cluster assembly ATPase SufC